MSSTKSKSTEIVDVNVNVEVEVEVTEINIEEEVLKEFDDICNEFANIKNTIGSLTLKLRQYKKKIDKILKEKAKVPKVKVDKPVKVEKEKKKKVIEPPSGINKPCLLSDELCKFLDKPSGTEMVRTDVTKELYAYIKDKKLQDSTSKLLIHPDKHLQNLLGIDETHKLTYQNIQTYMNKHYQNGDNVIENDDN
jgi:chromatin remodeling complex protein RSC6